MTTVKLYENTSEAIKVDKVLKVLVEMTGAFRQDVSMVDPVFTLEVSNTSGLNDQADLALCNYAYIPAFRRYYFVRGIRQIRTNLLEVSCHVDVLSTYAAQIRKQKAILAKHQSIYNLYLDDGSMPVLANKDLQIIEWKTAPFAGFLQDQTYLLTVAG